MARDPNLAAKKLSLRRKRNASSNVSYERLEPRQLLVAAPIITEFLASNNSSIMDDNGNDSDWIEIYNAGDTGIDLAGYRLTDDAGNTAKWVFPSVTLASSEFLVVFASDDTAPGTGTDLYTGFKLSAGGEYLGFYDPAGDVVTEFSAGGANYPTQYPDVSYGLEFGGSFDQISYFATPTPGDINTDSVEGIAERVNASVQPGFFETSISVELTTTTPAATIRYTLDGSTPSLVNGNVYSGPLTVSETTNVRAIATKTNFLTVPDRTWSYLFLDDILTQSNDGSAPTGWPSTWGSNDVDYGIDSDVVTLEGTQQIKDALLAIPTWSITTDLENLFDETTGIYANALQDGSDWERPASVELLNPDGDLVSPNSADGFQVNAGLRIRGGFSRNANNPKHAFRLFFRGEYGDSSLQFPVHGTRGTDTFEKIDLRTAQNYSWSFYGDERNNFIAEVLARENQLALGEQSTRSSWLHLYLNGQYWGLYQTQERAEANLAASYFGGSADDYDVIKPERGPYSNEATDGNFTAYNQLFLQANARAADGTTPAFVDDAAYLKAQGLNPDGTDNPLYENLLDVDNLTAYMIEILNSGNFDAPISAFLGNNRINNYYAIRNRNGNEGFRFFIHDSEHSRFDQNRNRNGPYNHENFESGVDYFNPQWLHQQLMANEEYRVQFADKVQWAFFNGGPMTLEAQTARLDAQVAAIDLAIKAESARWGDAKAENENDTRLRSDWLDAVSALRNSFLPARNAIFLEQLRNTVLGLKDTAGEYTISVQAPLFPFVDAPGYLINGSFQSGGDITANSELRLTASEGTIYYTLDGSDPRLPGGGISTNAIAYDPALTTTTLFGSGSAWNYNDLGLNLGTDWNSTTFDDASWDNGNSELGYGDGDEATVVSFGGDSNNKHATTYFRKQFEVPADAYTQAKLRIRRDDGAVAYLNGVEIARSNIPAGDVNFDTFATSIASNDGNTWYEFDVDPGLLTTGTNTIAVEIHQGSRTSSDITFDAEFMVSAQSETPITLNTTTLVNSRTLGGGDSWSALHSAQFVLPASQADLRITEINYNPAAPTAAEIAAGFTDNDDFEFIEIFNSNPTGTINLSGVQLADGVSFTFGDVDLLPSERAVVVEDVDAFMARYDSSVSVLGQWSGGLSNSGEELLLLDDSLSEVMSVDYSDSGLWTVAADGVGATLVLNDPLTTPQAELGKHYHWRGSVEANGTPGVASAAPLGVVVNEVLAHTDLPQRDSIELFNPTNTAIDIGGWFLSDAGNNWMKFEIPAGTIIGSGEYLVYDESDFNPTPNTPGPNDFALSAATGDQVYLTRATAGVFEGFEDVVDFGGTFNGESLGRLPDGTGPLLRMDSITLGAANEDTKPSPLIISEFSYNPGAPSGDALAILPTLTSQDLEFIEVTNPTLQTIDMTGWRLRGEVDFDFAVGFTITPGQTVVVATFDPQSTGNGVLLEAFRTHYDIDETVVLLGMADSGNLSNSYGRISLQQPDTPPADNPTFTPHVSVDQIIYDDLAPWPTSADGTGTSLNRIAARVRGTDALNWNADAPSLGNAFVGATVLTRNLFYNNSAFDGNSNGAGSNDDQAIAIDKVPLFNGITATFDNYSNFVHGINGIMIDVLGLTTTPTISDFQFQIGNEDNTSNWSPAPAPISVSVRPGDGGSSTDRISLVWDDGVITNTWLQITMSISGLASPEVFYFGNVIGESGTDPANARVNLIDVAQTRANQTGFSFAEVDNAMDYNRDERVNLIDVNIARSNQSGFSTVNLITPGSGQASAPPRGGAGENTGGLGKELNTLNRHGAGGKGILNRDLSTKFSLGANSETMSFNQPNDLERSRFELKSNFPGKWNSDATNRGQSENDLKPVDRADAGLILQRIFGADWNKKTASAVSKFEVHEVDFEIPLTTVEFKLY